MLFLLFAVACAQSTPPRDGGQAAAPPAPPPNAALPAPALASDPHGTGGSRGASAAAWPAPSTWRAPEPAALRVEAPGCEASAAAYVESALLIGDNEVEDALVWMPQGPAGPARALALPTVAGQPWPIGDIEALAPVAGGLAVVGSGSLRSASSKTPCAIDPDRGRFALLEGLPHAPRWSALSALPADGRPRARLASPEACRSWLGPELTGAEATLANTLCAALVAAEQGAVRAEPQACAAAWNVEAAVGDADGRLWLGLRAPVLPDGAALLRVAPQSWGAPGAIGALQIDAVALLQTPAGMGLRGMDAEGDLLVAIVGPMADADGQAHAVFAVERAALKPGARIRPRFVQALPPRSEAVVLSDDQLLVLVDGDAPGKKQAQATCRRPSGWLQLPRPSAAG